MEIKVIIKNYTNEIWKTCVEDNDFEISNLGRVRNKITNKILTQYNGPRTYKSVDLKNKRYLVHRLVAECFIDNPNNYEFVNHKDENTKNNEADNLEWCTKNIIIIMVLQEIEHLKIVLKGNLLNIIIKEK